MRKDHKRVQEQTKGIYSRLCSCQAEGGNRRVATGNGVIVESNAGEISTLPTRKPDVDDVPFNSGLYNGRAAEKLRQL